MTIAETRRHLTEMLTPAVGQGEASAMASAIIEDVKGYKPVDVALYGYRELLPETIERMTRVAEKVVAGEPLQYALGTAYFRGRHFAVTPDTLIPRPETAQLVDLIVSDFSGRSDLRVLDIGTGTGCIAISLALDLPFARVDAVDISPQALKVAQANADALKAKHIRFIKADALHLGNESLLDASKYDIIVSNPPYVLESEKTEMDSRVLNYEPASALFVPDSDPLKFYTPIIKFAERALAPSGKLYFEINPKAASHLKSALAFAGFTPDILPDYKGTLRFAIASR